MISISISNILYVESRFTIYKASTHQ